jgi:HK97 family phage prohead protease
MRFAGYAAVFDRPDSGGDVVRKGAFAEALKRSEGVPLLLQHKGEPVGTIEHLSEDRRGLRVIARVVDGRVGDMVRRGLRGLSFGYRVREAKQDAGLRELRSLDLLEVSLVSRPMQRFAKVHAVES